ncbi:MAG: hypothetical protein HP493_02235 [Nitrospira sp.]|nr:hypothetical protein [Nitrospira sp.]
MTRTGVLFYPFHLCHGRTLQWLLERYEQVHFRDYMAIQISPFCGTTAFPERMGDSFPDLLTSTRLVQGYNVSGPLNQDTCTAVDRDLTDSTWRALFHSALVENRRFQRGLFDGADITGRDKDGATAPALMARLKDASFETTPFTVARICELSRQRPIGKEADLFDYSLALLKTSASLVYTIQLAIAGQLAVATDSRAHCTLLTRLVERTGVSIENRLVEQDAS